MVIGRDFRPRLRLAAVLVLALGIGACAGADPSDTPRPQASAAPTAAGADAPFSMPDVTGLPYVDARTELRELGSDVRRSVVPSNEDRHLVVGQSMKPGVMVASGTRVTLRVSSGEKRQKADEAAQAPLPPTRVTAVPDLPSGLYCRDLKAQGYSYAEAVWYWDLEGRPERMDVGGDGIPCTTVYPADQVDAYRGERIPLYELPAGLLCRDLYQDGYSYPEAVWYWSSEGRPARMDVGNDGIPCTTVYPASDVSAYWK